MKQWKSQKRPFFITHPDGYRPVTLKQLVGTMNDYPKFSVITPSFNQGRFIGRTIDSVLEQNYPNFEHFVIDGGSTDETLDVLRSYPHLKWVSERDNGQTDALNKGFARATGDVIAWINSDDWYAPGAFEAARQCLQSYPIIVGHCQITTGDGRPTEYIVNYRRNWFDLLKYWVPYSIPTQPSIFFHRRLLDEFELADGSFLDQGLNFCMDYEFWLRLFQRYEFKKVEKLFSYYRMYEDNKTGTGMDPLKPEMSRVFRRSERRAQTIEQNFSFVIPSAKLSDGVESTVASILEAKIEDSEIVIAGFAADGADSKELKRFVRDRVSTTVRLRFVPTPADTAEGAFLAAANECPSLYLVCVEPGSLITDSTAANLLRAFAHDQTAVVLPSARPDDIGAQLSSADGAFDINRVFSLQNEPLNFSIRKVALADARGLLGTGCRALFYRSAVLGLLFKGWIAALEKEPLFLSAQTPESLSPALSEQINAQIVLALDSALQGDEFAQHRQRMGASLMLPDALVNEAKRLQNGVNR